MNMVIEKVVVLKAPLARVWRAVTEAKEFGAWFGLDADGPFEAGKTTHARIAPTKVDPEVAKLQAPYAGTPCLFFVETVDPMRLFSFRWHPDGVDETEPTTLVTFEFEEVPGGTRLRIRETGFEDIPLAKRAKAFESNEGGWAHQAKMIEKYLAG